MSHGGLPLLDDRHLYRALIARDARFDGVFFIGVTSTGVYCRPVCRAPKPRPERCRYFASAAAAERSGFRPCLRCRPELAPGPAVARQEASGGPVASVDAVGRLARLAALRIADGALDEGSVQTLATQFGISARHLRRAVQRELGVSPLDLATTRRLLMAKQLLTETDFGISRVAFASGFGSLRRFNALFCSRYRMTPSTMRRRAQPRAAHRRAAALTTVPETLSLSLGYRAPYDWPSLRAYLAARAIPGVEIVTADGRYRRTVRIHGCNGYLAVESGESGSGRSPGPGSGHLRLEISTALIPVLIPLVSRMRRFLDLDTDAMTVAADLGRDPLLAPLVKRRPGLRVPGAVDGFELALRAVLGQQVTVRGASTLAGRLVRLLGEPLADVPPKIGDGWAGLSHLPLSAERVAEASLASLAGIGLPGARAACLSELARMVAGGALPELSGNGVVVDPSEVVRRLVAVAGIGPWTAMYIVMRACHWPDAFPEGDRGLRQATGGLSPARLRALAETWRPWRAYAAQHLWAELASRTAKGSMFEVAQP